MMAAITTAAMMIHIVVRRVVTETMFTTSESRGTPRAPQSCGGRRSGVGRLAAAVGGNEQDVAR
jgi:hypothetical protein